MKITTSQKKIIDTKTPFFVFELFDTKKAKTKKSLYEIRIYTTGKSKNRVLSTTYKDNSLISIGENYSDDYLISDFLENVLGKFYTCFDSRSFNRFFDGGNYHSTTFRELKSFVVKKDDDRKGVKKILGNKKRKKKIERFFVRNIYNFLSCKKYENFTEVLGNANLSVQKNDIDFSVLEYTEGDVSIRTFRNEKDYLLELKSTVDFHKKNNF